MVVRADDGTVLQVKEAVVLGLDGEVLSKPMEGDDANRFDAQGLRGRVRVFRLGAWSAPLLVLGAVAAVTLGTFFFGLLALVAIALGLVRGLRALLR